MVHRVSRINKIDFVRFSPVRLGKRVFRIKGIKGVKRNLRGGVEAGLMKE